MRFQASPMTFSRNVTVKMLNFRRVLLKYVKWRILTEYPILLRVAVVSVSGILFRPFASTQRSLGEILCYMQISGMSINIKLRPSGRCRMWKWSFGVNILSNTLTFVSPSSALTSVTIATENRRKILIIFSPLFHKRDNTAGLLTYVTAQVPKSPIRPSVLSEICYLELCNFVPSWRYWFWQPERWCKCLEPNQI